MPRRIDCLESTIRNMTCQLFENPTGCAVGPQYKKPAIETSAQYKEGPVTAEAEAKTWKTATPQDEAGRGKWWELFGDSQLNALEEKVIVSNQTLKGAEAQYREARAQVRVDRAGYYPTITTSPSVTRSRASENRSFNLSTGSGSSGSVTGVGTTTNYSLPIDLSYEVDVWGRIRRTVEASSANAQASAADVETARLSLQAELAFDYFTLRALDAQKALLDSTVVTFEKALQLTRNRHDAGIASGADVAQAETQLETTRAQDIDVGIQRAQLEHAIALLIGQSASTFSISSIAIEGPPPDIPEGLPSQLLERRPDIAAAERRVAAANAQIGVAQAAFFPSLLLSASGGFESSSFSNWLSWPSRFWSLGPALLQTLFDGGRRRAISDQAWAAYDGTVANYRESVLTGFQEVEDNLAALRILAEEAEVQNAAVQAAERSLEISNDRYQGGIVAYLEVLTAQSALLANQRTAVDLLQRRMTASVLLIKALGGGWNAQNLAEKQSAKSGL
jgi:NodT family efflux transporter outer membrane factor (OMF) lipoprotein